MKKHDSTWFSFLTASTKVVLSVGMLAALTACGDAALSHHGDDFGITGDVVRQIDSQLTTCNLDSDCLTDEACTQGGHCVNITGERDATAVLQAELNELADPVGMGTPYRLPANAILQLNDLNGDGSALRIDNKIIFDGRGSVLKVQNGIIGIRVGQPAEWSLLRDFRIDPQDSSQAHNGIGVDVRAHGVRLENLSIWRMGTGVRAYTYVGSEFANINSQQWSRLVLRGIYDKAIDIRGGDANASLMTGFEVIDGAGLYDRSFLGNTYLAPTMEGTHNQSLEFASNAGRNLTLGGYIEEGDPTPLSISMHDLHVGGNAVSRVQGPGDRVGNQAAHLRFQHPESGMRNRIPGSAHAAMAWRHHQEGEDWFLRYWTHPSMLSWGISYRNSGTAPLRWTGGEHSAGPGQLHLGNTVQ